MSTTNKIREKTPDQSNESKDINEYKNKVAELEHELNDLKKKQCLPSLPEINFPDNSERKPTSKNIKASLRVYPTVQPNSKGYHISNYAVVVDSEEYPFSTLDGVDYFLENLMKYIKNSKLPNNSDQKKNDDQFFQSYTLPMKEIVPAISMNAGSSNRKKTTSKGRTCRNRKKRDKKKKTRRTRN